MDISLNPLGKILDSWEAMTAPKVNARPKSHKKRVSVIEGEESSPRMVITLPKLKFMEGYERPGFLYKDWKEAA
jgi:hypothetical protein